MDLSSLTGMFVGLHVLAAGITDTPEFAITLEDGEQFMKAAQNVLRHYSVETTQKSLDIIALIGTTTAIYSPRIAAYGFRKRDEMKKKSEGNVVPFPNGVYHGDPTI